MKTLFAFLLAGIVSAHALPPTSQSIGQPPSGRETVGPLWNSPGAANPIIPGYFADPTIRKFGDTYYLYATTDGTGNGYGPAQVWVSKDFRNWKNMVMNWPTTEVVWAPDVVQQPDGTFRYYYCRPCEVLAGESQSPVGPWKNILGKDDAVLVPDRFVHNAITLDPQLFRDDDGQEYLYFCTWGIYQGFGCGVTKVNGTRLDEKKLIPNTELKDIFEAPFVFKRNGVYYFTYSSGSCHDHTYRVQYATSTVGPMGPFQYKGCILETNADQTVHGPGHHSILEQDGHYYIVYHRHNLPRSVHGFNRQVCIDEVHFDNQGNILPIVPTHHPRLPEAGIQKERNLAFGASVTASSYYDDSFKPDYAVDDNNATLWKAAGTNWSTPQSPNSPSPHLLNSHHDEWLQIDLGRPQKFSEVWTQFEYATFFYQYKIETSLDGRQWTLFADRTRNTMQGSPMIDRAPSSKTTKARYLRITVTDTQKNGHIPAIWNVKVWRKAPELPQIAAEAFDGYPGMHQKDVEPSERTNAAIALDVSQLAQGRQQPFDVTETKVFRANKPIRARVKDGRWALFFNGSQHLTTTKPLLPAYRYNSPYTIAAWVLSTKVGPVATVASLSASRADLATTEFRLGTDPQAGLIHHNGSFESCGLPDVITQGEGHWQHWVVTFDGWMERAYLNGQLVHEQNNFLMVRPEGPVTIGADGMGTNSFTGYISQLTITPTATTAEEAAALYRQTCTADTPSLGDDDFDESDPDSRFTLPETMKPVLHITDDLRLSATDALFNESPWQHGGRQYKEIEGDFVMMARVGDMEGLATLSVKGYNEVGLLVSTPNDQYYQLGAFPLYNCGNMFTVLSSHGRPQYPNYKGYDFDSILQFERRGNLLYARTSRDGRQWTNMPGSPVAVDSHRLAVGIYQTTYTDSPSWATLHDIVIYQ
ncbi:MAG: family 43 glycosylhydrolase [Prevotella sp.]|nr:family 43 glycosylhydrolase [Prevotella sp.]